MAKEHFETHDASSRWAAPLRFYNFQQPIGDVFFVHSAGSSTGPGYSYDNAFDTIDAAIGACTADNGDVIFVAEDHTETITAASGIDLDVAGVRIVGNGTGRNRPRITFTTDAAASLDIAAARCSIENLVLINGIDSQTAMVNVSAADCIVEGCEFMLGDVTTQAVLGILTTAAADRFRASRNHMHGSVDAGVSAAIRLVGGDAILIEENVIVGAFATTGNIENITTACTMLTVRCNYLLNRTADGNNVLINLHASTTGLIANNRGGIIDTTSPAPIVAAAGNVAGNIFSGNVGVGITPIEL